MTFDTWVDELCAEFGIEDDLDVDAILDLARDAAHDVERRAAPITTFIAGLAAGRSAEADAIDEVIARAAARLRGSAAR
jgi:Domain of unknown function (DUF6457)